MYRLKTRQELAEQISDAFQKMPAKEKHWKEKGLFLVTHNWRSKLTSFAIVLVLWMLLAGQQDFEATFNVPITTINLPKNMEIVSPLDPTVEVTVKGLRKDASTLDEESITATLDLSLAKSGRGIYILTSDHILLPMGRLSIIKIDPSRIVFDFKRVSKQ